MIDINIIRNYFPESIRDSALFEKHLLKEYLQLMILDFISTSEYADKLCFIGGTNLRLIQKIDRFSEDLDFDCKGMTKEDFLNLTDSIVFFLQRNGLNVETQDKENPKLTAFRRNLYFPRLLFEMNLTGHPDERFLIKIEAQDQGIGSLPELKQSVNELMSRINIESKSKDFEHLLFNSRNSTKILRFAEFINSL